MDLPLRLFPVASLAHKLYLFAHLFISLSCNADILFPYTSTKEGQVRGCSSTEHRDDDENMRERERERGV